MDYNVMVQCPKCNKMQAVTIEIKRDGLFKPVIPSFDMKCDCDCEFRVLTTLRIEAIPLS